MITSLSILMALFLGENIENIEIINGGYANNLYYVETNQDEYIFRYPKNKGPKRDFEYTLKITEKASELGICPPNLSVDWENHATLARYIPHAPWPGYEENTVPYLKAMDVLKQFHQNVSAAHRKTFAPFSELFKKAEEVATYEDTPSQYQTALKKTKQIYQRLIPLFKKNAALCHGDFHKNNVLWEEEAERCWIIDLDTCAYGHPYFDIAKFTCELSAEQRQELFCAYLGKTPSFREQIQFDAMRVTLLLMVATVRLQAAHNNSESSERLSKAEMEELLNSETPLPSFTSIPFSATSPKDRQLGAIYALHELL